MNSFGHYLRLTTFGESHGPAMGGVLDGFPSGERPDFALMKEMLARRRPGSSPLVTSRRESDEPAFLSGISPEGLTLGTPIAFIVRNRDHRSADYDAMRDLYRPNHADLTTEARYGLRDHRGGGRASARETVSWVIGGALAAGWLRTRGITAEARLTRIGGVEILEDSIIDSIIAEARRNCDSVGGVVSCVIKGVRLGEAGSPVFDKLHASLGRAMLSINGVHGFEYGVGFAMADARGSQVADTYRSLSSDETRDARIPVTNFSGGIQGGISNGNDICFRVAFKPTPTIGLPLDCLGRDGEAHRVELRGRHDPCIAIRGAVVVEAMAALAIADAILESGIHSREV